MMVSDCAEEKLDKKYALSLMRCHISSLAAPKDQARSVLAADFGPNVRRM